MHKFQYITCTEVYTHLRMNFTVELHSTTVGELCEYITFLTHLLDVLSLNFTLSGPEILSVCLGFHLKSIFLLPISLFAFGVTDTLREGGGNCTCRTWCTVLISPILMYIPVFALNLKQLKEKLSARTIILILTSD